MSVDAAERLIKWLQIFSGCRFVGHLSSQQELNTAVIQCPDDATPSEIGDFFNLCSENGEAGVAVFPDIQDFRELAALLNSFVKDPAWKLELGGNGPEGGTLVALNFQTPEGKWSSTMGLAPLLSMPQTRRAPYVAIAAWPGKQTLSTGDEVGFIDMPTKHLDDDERSELVRESSENVETYLGADPDEAPWRDVAFCLNGEVAKRLKP